MVPRASDAGAVRVSERRAPETHRGSMFAGGPRSGQPPDRGHDTGRESCRRAPAVGGTVTHRKHTVYKRALSVVIVCNHRTPERDSTRVTTHTSSSRNTMSQTPLDAAGHSSPCPPSPWPPRSRSPPACRSNARRPVAPPPVPSRPSRSATSRSARAVTSSWRSPPNRTGSTRPPRRRCTPGTSWRRCARSSSTSTPRVRSSRCSRPSCRRCRTAGRPSRSRCTPATASPTAPRSTRTPS